jgi:hypothetical protein
MIGFLLVCLLLGVISVEQPGRGKPKTWWSQIISEFTSICHEQRDRMAALQRAMAYSPYS